MIPPRPSRRRPNAEKSPAPKRPRDIGKRYTNAQFVAKLRRLADVVESGGRFEIRIAGERIRVPAHAVLSIEHERADDGEEIEFQVRWTAMPPARAQRSPPARPSSTVAPARPRRDQARSSKAAAPEGPRRRKAT